MKIDKYLPVICVRDVALSRDFYRRHFGFHPVFDSGWYVLMTMPRQRTVNLGLIRHDHETMPEDYRRPVSGLLLNFETAEVDAEFERLSAAGLPMVVTLRDEPFGQRHFIVADPDGNLIDVIKPIPMSAEFEAAVRGRQDVGSAT